MTEQVKGFVADAHEWARQEFGQVVLGDARLERRAVQVAARMAELPAASLPQQMANHTELTGAYRLLGNRKVSHEALSSAHWQATRQRAAGESVVLIVQDTSQLDYTRYAETMNGLAPMGDGNGRGLLLHTTLAVVPRPRRVLGIAHQQVYKRVPPIPGVKPSARPKTERESRVWGEAVRAMGKPPGDTRWVVVSDAETDHTDFLLTCREQGHDFNVRLGSAMRVILEGDQWCNLRATVRSWPAVVSKRLKIRGQGGRKARRARVQVSFRRATFRVPKGYDPLEVWIVRAWEIDAPADVEPVEWILATSVPVQTAADALERLEWYTACWLVEDFHQCLNTGCAVERRDFEDADRIERLLGLLAPVAARLLQLREDARLSPNALASTVADPLMVSLLAAKLGVAAGDMTVSSFWRGVARLGGFPARRGDGDPGWKTLWRGWLHLEAMAQGARLAASLPTARTCV